MLDLLRRYKKTAVTFAIFVVYTAALLASYYGTQRKLESDVLNEVRLETEKQAAAISYFFAERRNDLVDLAASTEVGNFFANRDLGMSYEYGLAINIQSIESQFARILAQKRIGGTPIYGNIVLIDGDGRLIASTAHGDVTAIYKQGLQHADINSAAIFVSADQQMLYVTAPVWVKGVYRGQVVAWSDARVHGSLMADGRRNRPGAHLVLTSAFRTLAEGITADSDPRLRTALATLAAQPAVGAMSDETDGDIIAIIRVNVAGSPFSLIAPISGRLASERSVPLFFLVVAAIVPVVVLVIAFLDVFERRRTEEMREAARIEAERLARLRSEFLANMSHEIRTPLNGVLGLAQIGFRNNAGRPEAMDTFARILESGKLLLGIVNDVLDFSKIEAGKLPLEQTPIDLHSTVDGVVRMHMERASAKGIALRADKSANLPTHCLGDSIRLAQVLTNLLSNAVKFTDHGSVVLSAELIDDCMRLRVADTGIGMSAEQIGRLFAPFEQADSGTTRRFGGTGLGLAITKRLVDLMGGNISVDSQPGIGSTFEVRLPFVPVPAGTPIGTSLPRPLTSEPRLRGVRILVADDNDVNRLILEDMLAAEGATTTLVENGQQAVDRIANDGPTAFDVVLMDIQMPVMDGFEAARRIRSLAPSLPIIAETAHAFAEELQRCQVAGMQDYVTKPIDCERMVEVVRRHALAKGVLQAESPRTPPSPHRAPATELLVDWAVLRGRYAHKPDFLQHLLETALNGLKATPDNLRAALLVHDDDRIIFLLHSLKGVAGTLAASALAKQANEAELACRSHSAGAENLAAEVADVAQRMAAEVLAQLTTVGEPGSALTQGHQESRRA